MTAIDTSDLTIESIWLEESDRLATTNSDRSPFVETQVIDMRRSGLSIPAIARQTGLTPARVSGVLKRVAESVLASTSAADVRAEALLHYDHLLELVMARIVNHTALDFKALNAALRIIEARRKLMGADAPVTHTLDVVADPNAKQESAKKLDDFADQIAERGIGSRGITPTSAARRERSGSGSRAPSMKRLSMPRSSRRSLSRRSLAGGWREGSSPKSDPPVRGRLPDAARRRLGRAISDR